MAEAIFNHQVRAKGLHDVIEADSCGTANYHVGDNADPRTISAVQTKGVIIDHCVRQLTTMDLDHYDYVLAMDKSNFRNIGRLANASHRSKVVMIRDFDPSHKGAEVPDPYYGNERHFEEVYQMLDRAISHFIDHLIAVEGTRLLPTR